MKSKFLVSIVACLSIFQACDNCLDETKYTYSISSETFYNTLEEANAAVLAPLDVMRSAYNSNFFATLEPISHEVNLTGLICIKRSCIVIPLSRSCRQRRK